MYRFPGRRRAHAQRSLAVRIRSGAIALAAILACADGYDAAISFSDTGTLIAPANAKGRGGRGDGGNSGGGFSGSRSDFGRSDSARSDSGKSESGRSSEGNKTSNEGSRSSGEDRQDAKDQPQDRSSNEASAKSGKVERRAKDAKQEGSGGNLNEPPRTLVETFDRLFKPTPKQPDKPSAKQPEPARPAPPSNAARATALPGARAHLPYVHTSGKSHTDSEVLAVNLSPAALQRARALGFTVAGKASLTQLTSEITRLVSPAGFDASQSLELLRTNITSEKFGLNRIYRIYKVQGAGLIPAKQAQPASKPGVAVPCKGDRCAGRELIGWQPQLSRCSAGLRVAVIDTGVDGAHPALESRQLRHGTFVPKGGIPAPNWHGTGVLALLAGDPKSGTPGLIPEAEFFVASVFFQEEDGGFATDTYSLLGALDWISAWDVQVVNMSFAGPKDDIVQKEIEKLSAGGIVFVAAAGNEGPMARPSYPAAYRQVIAVTAVNKELRNFAYANRGSHIDVSAPGVDIWTAVPGGKEGYYTGTSFAAPYVTAAMATIYAGSKRRDKASMLSLVETKDLGAPGRDPIYGRGVLVAPAGCQPNSVTASGTPPASVAGPSAPMTWPASVQATPAARATPVSTSFR